VTTDLAIECRCGALRGVVQALSPRVGRRVVCYCDDCQAFARYLGTASDVLDAHGGTDIFQMSPARLGFSQGTEHLVCVRLTPKGGLRWFTDCCRTAIGNTPPTGQLPFVGLIHTCMNTEERALDEIIGPVRSRVMGRYARGDLADIEAHDGFPLSHIAAIFAKILVWRLRGDHKRSPFFDAGTGAPIARPQVPGDNGPTLDRAESSRR
jgi:hypothetical protein